MAKKKKEETAKKATPKKENNLKDLSLDYFKRFPNVSEFFVTEDKTFYFKLSDAKRNAKGGKVETFKRQ